MMNVYLRESNNYSRNSLSLFDKRFQQVQKDVLVVWIVHSHDKFEYILVCTTAMGDKD